MKEAGHGTGTEMQENESTAVANAGPCCRQEPQVMFVHYLPTCVNPPIRVYIMSSTTGSPAQKFELTLLCDVNYFIDCIDWEGFRHCQC